MRARNVRAGSRTTSMRRRVWALLQNTFLVLLFGALPGCRDYSVSTVIHPDGSCDRTITFKSDSKVLPSGGYRLPADTSWHLVWKAPENGKGDYTYEATRHFASLRELSSASVQEPDSAHFAVTLSAESQFRWFYTYFEYTETFGVFNPYTLVPATQYLSEDEIARFSTGDTSASLKKAIDMWQDRCRFEELFRQLVEAGKRSSDSALSPRVFESRKEAIYNSLVGEEANRKRDRRLKSSPHPAGRAVDEKFMVELVLPDIAAALGTRNVYKLRDAMVIAAAGIMKKDELLRGVGGNFTFTITLPGIVLATNAGELKASTVTWRFSDKQLLIREYRMHAESRVANTWAIAASAVVVLGAILGMGLSILRKHRIGA